MHKKQPNQQLVLAQSQLQSREYSTSLEILKGVDRGSLTPEENALFCILFTESCLYLGDYSVDLLDEPIEFFRHVDSNGYYGKSKYLRGWRQTALGKHRDAQESLMESYAACFRSGKLVNAAAALNQLSLVALQLGKVDSAASNLERSAVLYAEVGDLAAEIAVKTNLAYVYLLGGRIHQCRGTFDFVRDSVLCQGPKNAAIFYVNSSLPFAMQGQFVVAIELLDKCRLLVAEFPHQEALYYENLGFLYLQQQKFAECRKALRAGLEISLRIAPESALVSQIKRLQADCAVATGKFAEAQKHATEALAVAEKIGQRLEIAACWRVFGQVAAHDKKQVEARDWFRKSIEMFNQISARYELAVARYAAASSEMFERSEAVAMLYLAKEYCEAEQVAPYLEKINASLAKLEPRKAAPVVAADPSNRVITRNKRMLAILDLAAHVAPSNMTVLLTGETGTGKDLLAQWIHDQSRRTGRFLSQNFAALPSQLAESELFGHRKGAFTGASMDKPGLFEAADGGTFFLNEIAEAPLELQAKLLEIIETHRLRRLGETTDRSVDVRIIAATNHDLAKAVRENRFRADLYHRFNEINIVLPPLADRMEDIPDLIAHFVKQDAGKEFTNGDASTLERLSSIISAHSWPGNVRELRTFMRKLLVIAENDLSRLPEIAQDQLPLTDESQLVRILEQNDWNQTRAAEMLGVSEGTIRKRIRKFGLDRD